MLQMSAFIVYVYTVKQLRVEFLTESVLQLHCLTLSSSLALTLVMLTFMHSSSSSSFLACNARLRSAIRRHHPPQRTVLSQICCFGERKVVLFQILLDGAEPRDAGTT